MSEQKLVLVCGGRDFDDASLLWRTLDALAGEVEITGVLHGGALGADAAAGAWARHAGYQEIICPANWQRYDGFAGPLRNRAMLRLRPNLVLAFPGGKGTANMVKLATLAQVEVRHIAPVVPPERSGE